MSIHRSAFESVNLFFDEAAGLIRLKDEMYDVLKTSYREVQVQVPVHMDDGRQGRPSYGGTCRP